MLFGSINNFLKSILKTFLCYWIIYVLFIDLQKLIMYTTDDFLWAICIINICYYVLCFSTLLMVLFDEQIGFKVLFPLVISASYILFNNFLPIQEHEILYYYFPYSDSCFYLSYLGNDPLLFFFFFFGMECDRDKSLSFSKWVFNSFTMLV